MSLRQSLTVAGILLSACVCTALWACGGYGQQDHRETSELVSQLGNLAIGSQELAANEEVLDVVTELRRRGPAALESLLAYRGHRVGESPAGVRSVVIERLDRMIDKVAGQRFAVESKLFWHTSMSAAQQEAIDSNRPILSLRMLGRLDEDLSCANSRFFRTTLYPDPKINKILREKFVLHWQPVRDVPVVTIDFGDGRQLRRPLTGNSVHLVLNAKCQPIDVLPGLVSPDSFVHWLDQSRELFGQLDPSEETSYWSTVAAYHRDRAARRRADSELAIGTGQNVAELNPLDPRWRQLAERTEPVPALAAKSQELLNRELPAAEIAMPIAITKMGIEMPILRMVQSVGPHIARDSVFSRFALQTKIDDWFAARGPNVGYDANMGYDPLTDRIYSEVFLMPLSDPWLGLSSDTQFAALENGGRVQPVSPPSERDELSNVVLRVLNR